MKYENSGPIKKMKNFKMATAEHYTQHRAYLSLGHMSLNLALIILEENFKCSHLFFVTTDK